MLKKKNYNFDKKNTVILNFYFFNLPSLLYLFLTLKDTYQATIAMGEWDRWGLVDSYQAVGGKGGGQGVGIIT